MEIAKRINSIACGICLAFSVISGVQANPSGAAVVHGSATFSHPNVNTLNVTNSPGAIINWQQFGISQGELTRFIQQNANSAVLNRIIGQDPSVILGQLSSNGKVYLVNPNGIVFGQNSMVNTAGLIASTLNISNQDFINGQKNGTMRFTDLENAAEILNQGFISASDGGEVVFVSPKITNQGTISVDNGSIVLAAGQSVTINSLNYDNIEFEVQAPDNEVVNLGQMITDGGSVGVFAGSITNKGIVSANAVTVDDAGNIVFVAQTDTVIEDGTVTATSETGKGGYIEITGDRVGLFGETSIDASGATGGGEVLVGGDYQGGGEAKTAATTQVSGATTIRADAEESGDGGKVIVWANDFTLFYGEATARGGTLLGDGGFIEVSGKQTLNFDGWVDTTATNGITGTVLFDPKSISVYSGSPGVFDGLTNNEFAEVPDDATITFSNDSIKSILDTQNVILQANNDISWSGPLTPTGTFDLTLQAGRSILLFDTSGQILSTNGGNLTLIANSTAADGVVDAQRDAGAGSILIGDNAQSTTINTNGGNITMEIRDGAGITNAQAGQIVIDGLSTVDSGGGDILFSAPDITILDTVNAGAGDITIQVSDGGDIGVGNTVADMTIDFSELSNITANNLTIKGTTVGPNDTNIIVQDENPSPSTLETSTAGIAGTITLDASNLGGGVIFQGTEQVRFDNPLTVLSGSAGILFDAGTVGLAGGLRSNGDLVLNAGSGTIQFTDKTRTISSGPTTNGGIGSITLSAGGGISTDAGTVSLEFRANNGITINDDMILNDIVTFIVDRDRNATGTFTIASGATLTSSAAAVDALFIDTADFDLQGNINVTNRMEIISSDGSSIDVGTDNGGSLVVTDAELSRITADRLSIRRTANTMTVDGVTAAGSANINTLLLRAGGGVYDVNAPGKIVVSGLGVDAANNLELRVNNNGLSINADVTAGGNIILNGDGDGLDGLGPDGIDFGVGVTVTSTSGNIDILADNGSVQSVGDVIFDAFTDFNYSVSSTFNGLVTITAGNNVNITGSAQDNSSVDIYAEVIDITAGGDVNLIAGSGSNSHAVLESFLGDITINSTNLNLDIGAAGSGSDAIIIANNGSGQLVRGATLCANCIAAGFIPDPDAINETSVIAANFGFTVTWDGGAATLNWLDPLNWSTDHLPIGNSDVDLTGAAGTVLFSGGTENILSLFSTGEALTINGGSLGISDTSSLNGLLTLSSGTLSLGSDLSLNAGMVWTTGATVDGGGSGGLLLPTGQILTISGGTTATLDNGNIGNDGTLVLNGDSTLDLTNGAVLINTVTGVIDLQGDDNIGNSVGAGTVDNFGTLIKSGGIGTSIISAHVIAEDGSIFDNQNGQINISDIQLDGNISFTGFPVINGAVSYTDGTTIFGEVSVGAGATITGNGLDTLFLDSGATFSVSGIGTTTFDNVLFNNDNFFTVISGVTLDLINGTVITNSVNGEILLTDTNITNSIGLGAIDNFGLIRKQTGASSTISATFSNQPGSVIDIVAGSLSLGGATLTLESASVLSGAGTFVGDVVSNGGSIQPGSLAAAGILTIDGNYSDTVNGGDVSIKIESALNDVLTVTGTADFTNTTLILIDNGATVSNGTNLPSVITAGGLLGNFAAVSNPFVSLDAAATLNANDIDLVFSLLVPAFTWNGGVGDWDIGTNWAGGVSPGIADDVFIIAGSTVNINFIENANSISLDASSSLVIGSGGLTIASASTLDGTLMISGGTLDIANNSTLAGTVNLSAGSIIGNGNVTLNGAFNWTGGALSGTGTWTTNAASTVSTGAVHDLNRNWVNNNSIDWSEGAIAGTGTLTNNANLEITGGFTSTLDGVSIDNQGTTTYSGAGNFELENNAVFINNGIFDYQSSNGDIVTSTDGLFDNYATVQRTINTGSASIQAAFNANTGTIFDGVSEALVFNAINLIGNISTLNLGATLGDGTHTITDGSQLTSGVLNWGSSTGASIIQGGLGDTFTIANGATLNLTGGFVRSLGTATIVNQGLTVFSGAGNWNIDNNGIFNNAATGIFELETNNASVATTTSGLFDNYGTVRRTLNTGSASIQLAFNANTGSVLDGVSEALDLNTVTLVGSFSTLNLGATLASGTHTIVDGSQLSSGVLNWDSSGGVSVIQGGAGDTFTIANSAAFNITGGFIKTLDTATINNQGTTVFNSSANWNIDNNAVFTNAVSGIFELEANNNSVTTTGAGLFDNFGTVRRTVNTGSGRIAVAFNANTGSVIDGVSEALEFSAMNINGSISTLNSGGTLADGIHTFTDGSQLASGILNWQSAGGVSTIQGTGTETFTIENGASFILTGGFLKTLDNATIENQGTTVYNSTAAWNLDNNAVFRNAVTGIFDLETNNSKVSTSTPGASSGLFDNFGTVRRITNTGTSSIQVAFNANAGTVIDGISEAVEFEAMTILGDITALNLGGSLVGGTHSIAADAQLLSGILNWDSGVAGASVIQGTGSETFTVASGATFIIFGGFAKTIDNVTIDNLGVTNFVSGSNLAIDNSGSFINNTTGTFDIQFDGDIVTNVGSGSFINQGLLQKTGGLANSQISVTTFTNSAGTIDIFGGKGLGLGGADLMLGAGSVLRGNGTFLENVINDGGSIQPGSVAVAGTLTIDGDYSDTASAGDVRIKIGSALNDQLIITGSADFTNTTLVLVDNGAIIVDGLNLLSVISTGTLVSDFASVTNPFAGFTAQTVNNAVNSNNLDLLFNLIVAGLVWTGSGGDGDWSNALNWSAGVPTLGDDISIGAFDVTISGPASANSISLANGGTLTLASGTLTIGSSASFDGIFTMTGGVLNIGNATVAVNNAFNWSGTSSINGLGTGVLNIAPGAVFNIAGNVQHTLNNVTVINQGTTNYSSAGAFLLLNDNSTFNNNATFDFQNNNSITRSSGNGTFNNNAGASIIKTVGAGTSSFAGGALLTLKSSDSIFNAATGNIEIQSKTEFDNAVTITGSDLVLNSTDVTFNDGSSINGNVSIAGGLVKVSGNTTVNDLLSWNSASTITGGGNLIIAPAATMNINNNVNHTVDGIMISNQGTINYSSAGAFLLLNNTDLNNTGIFKFNGNNSITSSAGISSFNNLAGGSIVKSSGTGAAAINTGANLTYTHTGAMIDVQTGSLSIGGPLTLDAGSVLQGAGAFTGNVINTAGSVRPGGSNATGILTITGNYTQGPAGMLDIDLQGTTPGNGAGTHDQLLVTGNATLAGNLTIREINGFNAVALDSFTYLSTAGITGDFTGKRIFPVGFALPQSTATQQRIGFGDGTTIFFDNFTGNASWNDANNWSAGLVPTAGLDVNTAALAPGLPVIFISSGTHSINNLTTGSNINNTGANLTVAGNLTVPANFVYTQNTASAITQFDGVFNNTMASGVQINNTAGIININGAVNTATITNDGTIVSSGIINSGVLTNNINGLLTLDGTTVANITNTGVLVIDGGVTGDVSNNGMLSGSGTVIGTVTNGGELNPGNSPGTFTIDGDLNLLDTSILTIEISGLLEGQYDKLIVTGNVLFDGQLRVVVDSTAGYKGGLQDTFSPIIYGSSSGDFILSATPGYRYRIILDEDKLNLITTLVPGLFVPDTQSEINVLLDYAQNISIIESVDDVEAELAESAEEDDEEKGNSLVCT